MQMSKSPIISGYDWFPFTAQFSGLKEQQYWFPFTAQFAGLVHALAKQWLALQAQTGQILFLFLLV